MVSFSSTHRYYLYGEPADMRKSYDGLSGLVAGHMKRSLLSGEVFIFLNRRRDQVRMLVWDRTGFVLYSKRLERGTFERPREDGSGLCRAVSWGELQLILEGISLCSAHWRKRYVPAPQATAGRI
jgi:transposase